MRHMTINELAALADGAEVRMTVQQLKSGKWRVLIRTEKEVYSVRIINKEEERHFTGIDPIMSALRRAFDRRTLKLPTLLIEPFNP